MRLTEILPKGARRALRNRLRSKEKVLLAMPGFTVFRSRGRWIWPVYAGIFRPVFLIATNKRAIVLAKGWFRVVFYAWNLTELAWANFEPGWLADRVTVTAGGFNTHILFPKAIRKATKQLVHQIWQLINVRRKRKKRRIG